MSGCRLRLGLLLTSSYRDQGTDVVDILAGRVIPLRLGYVPVADDGQRDIETNTIVLDRLRALVVSLAPGQ